MNKNKKLSENLNIIGLQNKSEEQQAVEQVLRTSCFLRQEIEDICAKFNLTKSQYFVLKILSSHHPEALPRCEVIDNMIEPSPDVTRLIDRLESRGLAERFRSKKDARMSMSKLTKKGLDILADVDSAIYSYFQCIGDMLSKEECVQLIHLCKKLGDDEKK